MTRLYVKPAPDARVRNPDRDFTVMPEAGDFVADTPFWRRRLRDGDVIEASEPPPPPSPAD